MARNMVTRLVKGTQVEVKVINNDTDEISVESVILSKAFAENDTDKVKKAVVKHYDGSDLTVLKVNKFEPCNKLFGVPQAIFMANAVELDPETRKVLATGEDTTED